MFELSASQKAALEEAIIREFRTKLFQREGDLETHDRMKKAFSSNANISGACEKEMSQARNDIRSLTIAIRAHEERYAQFKAEADAEDTASDTVANIDDDDPVIG